MSVLSTSWQPGQDYQVINLDSGDALLFIVGNHRLLRISAELGQRLQSGIAGLSPEERAEWDRLNDAGVISAVNPQRLADSGFSDGANLAINVNLTAVCNLNCTYCFAEGGDYGRITGDMESVTVDHIFRFIDEHVTPSQTVRFEFFGGEPLLNFERIKEMCDRSDVIHRERGIKFIYRISTNLTALPKGTLELFAEKKFIVSVSLDGDEETHNRNRPTKTGKGSFHWIMGNIRKVREASDDITLVARMTVVGEKPSLAENVLALWKLNIFDYFQIYPGVVPAEKNQIFVTLGSKSSPGKTHNTVLPSFYNQLSEFVELYPKLFGQGNRFRGVLEYERIADMIANGKLALAYCSGGRNYFTFSPDDSIMPCHRIVGDTQFQAGTAKEGLTDSLAEWRDIHVDRHPTCSKCWIRYICGGGCKQENFVATGSLNEPNPEMCKYLIQLVETVVKNMERLGGDYFSRDRAQLDDLFVSCGKPLLANLRAPDSLSAEGARHFRGL